MNKCAQLSDSKQHFLQEQLVQQLGVHRQLVVAFSGGVDSTVLLHVLVKLRETVFPDLKLRAIYIHHGLSQNADAWAAHCLAICEDWNVPCIVSKVTLSQRGNIEAQARNARYEAISATLKDGDVVCTAQHLDDQAETFWLAVKRGSGPAGLSAMPVESDFGKHRLLRPLLQVSRADIEQYAAENQLSWIEDESNQDKRYDRNFLRLDVLPLLNQRWPQFDLMVARSAELCAEQESLLHELLSDELNQSIDLQSAISITKLADCSPAKRNVLLRMWLQSHGVAMPSRQQLTLLWQEVALAKKDADPQFILGENQIRRYRERLYCLPIFKSLSSIQLNWDLKTPLLLPDDLGQLVVNQAFANIRAPLSTEIVTICFAVEGRFDIVGRAGSRSIKKLWQELGIPPWLRQRIPLVFYNEQLITAVGVFVTEQGKGEDFMITYLDLAKDRVNL